jgi:hypothetical protein
MNVLKSANPTMTMPRCSSPPPSSLSERPRMHRASVITAKPVTRSGTRPTRSTAEIAIAKPMTRNTSSTAVPTVAEMSSAMKVESAPETAIAASSVGVKMPTP